MENHKFTKRVFGCAVIKSINGNYNADFTKQPRTLPDGTVYATDKALKYTIRHYLYQNYPDAKILYFTRNKAVLETGQMIPRSLRELYEFLFNSELPKTSKVSGKPKWNLFYYDGNKIVEKGQKIADKKLKEFFDKLENEPDYKSDFLKVAKDGEIKKREEIKLGENETESFYFFIHGNQIVKLENIDDENAFEDTLKIIDIEFFGGYDKLKILYNLLQCIDVRLFGATYTGDTNVSIHGTVQINHAKDRYFYKDNAIENLTYTEQIKSPVRNDKAKGGEAEMTTIGSQSKSMEAHYVHHFSINPKNLEDHLLNANAITQRADVKEKELLGLQDTDIDKLIEGLRLGATNYDSTAKAGVENELLVWIELLGNCKIVLPNFTEYIKIKRNSLNEIEIDLKDLSTLIDQEYIKNCIGKIDLYYNDVKGKPINTPAIDNKVFHYDILTGTQLNITTSK